MFIRCAPRVIFSLAFPVAGFCQATPEIQQATPDIQKVLERLDRLEKQNQDLMAEIQSLKKELAASLPAAQPSLAERMDVQESRTAELAQTKIETTQRIPVSLTGMLLFNAFKNGEYGGTLQYPVAAQPAPTQGNTGATFRQTVLGLKFNGPDLPGGGKASGSVYMDFWGGTAAPNNNLFRIRLATMSMTWKNTTITAGQDKPIMSPREPTTLAQVGLAPLSGAGNLWNWNPQGRIEQNIPLRGLGANTGVRAEGGLYESTEIAPANTPPSVAATLEKYRPAWEGRLNFYTGGEATRFEVAPGFHFSQTHVGGQSVPSKLGTVDWLVKPSSLVEFNGAFFKGENAAGLGGLRQGFTVLGTGAIIPVHVTGAWGQISLFPAPRVSVHLYAGFEGDRGSDLTGNSIRRNLIYAGNLIYKIAPNILAAFEVSQNRTLYTISGTRLNNHYDLALAYLF
jgi:hypothetical protein